MATQETKRQQRTTRVQHETYISFLKRYPELHLIKNEVCLEFRA